MDREKTRAVAEQIFRDMAGAMTAGMGYVGTRTGLFRAMAGKGRDAPRGRGARHRHEPRYVEEWLKGMAAAGYLDYDPKPRPMRCPTSTPTCSPPKAPTISSAACSRWCRRCCASRRGSPRRSRRAAACRFEEFGPDCVARARPDQPRPVRAPLHRLLAQGAAGGASRGCTPAAARSTSAAARGRVRDRDRARPFPRPKSSASIPTHSPSTGARARPTASGRGSKPRPPTMLEAPADST